MSTKPCPQCGATVPAQARFCGQCGRTFADPPGARAIPTTVDEATADPPPAQPAPPRHLGMA
ncbi:MAG: zinc ribbon domain-containing protein, partial [Labilithrix sp.]|nr:zinc ribbon domain-containing protein [Labilithrix sp.]